MEDMPRRPRDMMVWREPRRAVCSCSCAIICSRLPPRPGDFIGEKGSGFSVRRIPNSARMERVRRSPGPGQAGRCQTMGVLAAVGTCGCGQYGLLLRTVHRSVGRRSSSWQALLQHLWSVYEQLAGRRRLRLRRHCPQECWQALLWLEGASLVRISTAGGSSRPINIIILLILL